jgi:hypothetical protein
MVEGRIAVLKKGASYGMKSSNGTTIACETRLLFVGPSSIVVVGFCCFVHETGSGLSVYYALTLRLDHVLVARVVDAPEWVYNPVDHRAHYYPVSYRSRHPVSHRSRPPSWRPCRGDDYCCFFWW